MGREGGGTVSVGMVRREEEYGVGLGLLTTSRDGLESATQKLTSLTTTRDSSHSHYCVLSHHRHSQRHHRINLLSVQPRESYLTQPHQVRDVCVWNTNNSPPSFRSFRPESFSRSFSGHVPRSLVIASRSLASLVRSWDISFVVPAHQYRGHPANSPFHRHPIIRYLGS